MRITDTAGKKCKVESNGVIVRTEDAKSGGFNIAIFFNEIKDEQRQKISRYISQALSDKSPPPFKRL
jgi:hypothetical protein